MSLVYWDTMLFVYWLEDNQRYAPRVQQIFENMERRQDRLCTSTFTIGETLVGFHKCRELDKAKRVRAWFLQGFVELIPLTADLADSYAQIRAGFGVSSADALHLACAASAHTDLFLTNDRNLVGKIIPGIQFIAGLDSNII